MYKESGRRVISLLLCLVMLLGNLPAVSFAAESDALVEEEPEYKTIATQTAPGADLPDNEELFAGFAERELYGYEMATYSTAAREMLNSAEQAIYDALKPKIEAVARSGGSTVFNLSGISGLKTQWSNTELGVTSISNSSMVDKAFLAQFNLDAIVEALLSDCPFDLYWYDKGRTSCVELSYYVRRTGYSNGGQAVITAAYVTALTVKFAVASDYASGSYTVTSNVAKVNTARNNAAKIVANYAGSSDYQKLLAYKNEICDAVSYNKAAAGGNYAGGYGDPWQLISVFDGDASTNVVCEGYSKAFMYLCDLSSFKDDVSCSTVSGNMNGGPHMWNIVTMKGNHYLADVTNSDTGDIGEDGSLFLVGASGSATGGYTVGKVNYTYDSYTTSLWGTGRDSLLSLASESYTPGEEGPTVVDSGTCGSNLTWTLYDDGRMVVTGYGSMKDYDFGTSPFYRHASSITSVELPEGITTIGERAFDATFPNLDYIEIPTSVTHIRECAFGSTYYKVKLKYPGTMEQWNKISITSFVSYGMRYGAECSDGTIIYKGNCGGSDGLYNYVQYALLGDGTLKITGSGAMKFYRYLNYESCFSGDEKIKKVEIADGITNIAGYAFKNCANLTEVYIPASVKSISYDVFAGCTGLTDVYYGSSERDWQKISISESGNELLANATIHYTDPCKEGHTWTDATCTAPKTCSVCGATEGDPGDHTYTKEVAQEQYLKSAATCTAKAEYYYSCVCGAKGTETFVYGELKSHDYGSVVTGPTCTADGYTTYTCHCGNTYTADPVKKLGHDLGQWETTKEATCDEDGLKRRDCARCDHFETEVIPGSGHSHTSVVTAPTCTADGYTTHTCSCGNTYTSDPVNKLGHDVGQWETTKEETCDEDGLKRRDCARCDYFETDVIPSPGHDLGEWIVTEAVNCFRDGKQHRDCGKCGHREEQTIFTAGHDYVGGVCALCSLPEGLEYATVDGKVTITAYTGNAANLVIPAAIDGNPVTVIGEKAFSKCVNLQSVALPVGLERIENYAFEGCSRILNMVLPESVVSLGDMVFRDCVAMTTITLPDSVTTVGRFLFSNCSALRKIEIPAGLTEIAPGMFDLCAALEAITIPETVSSVGEYAFYYCTGLKQITFQGDLDTIHRKAFAGVTSTAYYPRGYEGWTKDALRNYSGTITWKVYCPDAHEFNQEVPAETYLVSEATCTEKAVYYKSCVCGEAGTNTFAYGEKKQHAYKASVTQPTCTQQGYTTHTCACGDSYVDSRKNALGHALGQWTLVTKPTASADGKEQRKCSRCDYAESRVVKYTGNVLTLTDKNLASQTTVWINGLPYPVQGEGNNRYVELPVEGTCYLVTYTWHIGDAKDVHTQYPTGMKVYKVTKGASGYTAKHIPELDNLLQYSGSSIRITGKKGIRMITSITKSNKEALTGKGLAGFKLEEYGTALCFASELKADGDLVLGKSYTRSNYAYKKGVADPVFAYSGKLVQYTNVLVGFNLDQCKQDIAMRPYIILSDASGNKITLYGGTIYRSIGYIAYQNRNVFKPGNGSYDYVWEIIHHVYGSKYDKDYKG